MNMLEDNKPCMIARFGFTEMNFLYSYLADKNYGNAESEAGLTDAMNRLCLLSGFFPR